MSTTTVYEYLELQELEPQDDGSKSELDTSRADESIDLSNDIDGEQLIDIWEHIESDMHKSK